MSTLDNSYQLSDDMIETEARLILGKSKVDLKLYQRNSMNKINFRSYLGKNFICSSHDKYRKIRVPIIAVFLKLLETKNSKNYQRIQKIKRLIYSSALQEIVNKHAITSEQLLSNFAFVINQLESEKQNLESFFIKKINAEPFFDKIIMQSFYEAFYDPKHEFTLTTRISKWMKNELEISIIFVQNQTQVETESVIFLRKSQKNEVLRQIKSFHICSMTSIIDESKEMVTPLKQSSRKVNQMDGSSKLFQSISSIQSPKLRVSTRHKPIEHIIPISVQNSIQFLNDKQNNNRQEIQPDEIHNFPISRRKNQPSESSFWKIFCCGSD